VLLAGERSLVATSDLATFEVVGSLGAGERVTAVAAGPAGFAATGTTVTGDGFVLAGSSPARLGPLDASAVGGVGEQVPTGLVVRDTDVVVLGLADGAPASWPVAID